MKAMTRLKVSLMRGHLLRFLEIANEINFDDWIYIIREVQKQKDRLHHMTVNSERGNFFILLFFLNEILQSVLEEAPD